MSENPFFIVYENPCNLVLNVRFYKVLGSGFIRFYQVLALANSRLNVKF